MGYILEAWKQLEEDVLLEGKNLEKTLDIYTPKFLDAEALYDSNEEETKEYIKHLISLDPTYKEGSNFTGDYGVWILDKYLKYHNQNKIDVFDRYDITQLLNDFINVKQSLPNKDIGSYKTFDDLRTAIDNATLSDRQKERRLRNSKDYHVVYQDKDWTVYVPDTYAGSCTLGKGTSWCTAYSENDEYYIHYTEQGPLYIVINNHDKSEKYQFHFESNSFMDKDDESILLYEFLLSNKGLMNFFDDVYPIKKVVDTLKKGMELVPDLQTFERIYYPNFFSEVSYVSSSSIFDIFSNSNFFVKETCNYLVDKLFYYKKRFDSESYTKSLPNGLNEIWIQPIDSSVKECFVKEGILSEDEYSDNLSISSLFEALEILDDLDEYEHYYYMIYNAIEKTLCKCNSNKIIESFIKQYNSQYKGCIELKNNSNHLEFDVKITDEKMLEKILTDSIVCNLKKDEDSIHFVRRIFYRIIRLKNRFFYDLFDINYDFDVKIFNKELLEIMNKWINY